MALRVVTKCHSVHLSTSIVLAFLLHGVENENGARWTPFLVAEAICSEVAGDAAEHHAAFAAKRGLEPSGSADWGPRMQADLEIPS